MARLAIESGREKKREEEERRRREEGRENNPNYDVVYDEESKRDERAEIPDGLG